MTVSAASAVPSAPPPPAPPPDRGLQAADRIRGLTRDDGFLGTSRNGNMHEVRDTLHALRPEERNAAVSKLSDADLEALADDVNSGGVFGAQGLSADEKRDLFNDFATGLDGRQLARLTQAFDSREDVIGLGQAVATHGAADAKVGFVEATAGRTTDNPRTDHFGFSSYSEIGDADAVAVGEVIGSLKGDADAVDRSLRALDDKQLEAVATAGLGQVNRTTSGLGGGHLSVSQDARVLTGVLDAAATGRDPAQKARAFEVGAGALETIEKSTSPIANGIGVSNLDADAQAQAVQGGLTRILDSDTTGVIRRLETADRTGGALSAYMTQTLSQEGGQAKVGELVARVQRGDALNENPAVRMEAQEGGAYRNAQSMGYLSGAIQVGVTKNAEDAKKQAELLTGIFSKVVDLGTAGLPPAAGAGVSLLTGEVMKAVVDEVSKSGDLSRAMYELTFPADPRTNAPYEGPAEPAYDSASSRVILANR